MNGDKTKIIWFLIGLIQAVFFWWASRIDANVTENVTKTAVLESNYATIQKSVDRVNEKLDALLQMRRRGARE